MKTLAVLMVRCAFAAAVLQSSDAVRGLAGEIEIDYGGELQARAVQAPTSPIVVRVTPLSGTRQRIEFVGTVAGTFDLREYLERADGRPLDDLPPLSVNIVSQLPPDAGTDLYSTESRGFNWQEYYRELLLAAVTLWLLVPIGYFVYRATRKPQPVAQPPTPQRVLTLEDRLRDALDSAAARQLSVPERAELELLVFRYFGERLRTNSDSMDEMVQVLRSVREHPETREFVSALERWLHAYGSSEADRARAAQALEELRRSRLAAQASDAPVATQGAEA